MNLEDIEMYMIIQDVSMRVHLHLQELFSGDEDYDTIMSKVNKELKRLVVFKPEKPQEEIFLLTKTSFGPCAYLTRYKDLWFVNVEYEGEVTERYGRAVDALNDYFHSCKDNDFLEDFMTGVLNGDCEFGDNDYALYLEKCFNTHVFGKEL